MQYEYEYAHKIDECPDAATVYCCYCTSPPPAATASIHTAYTYRLHWYLIPYFGGRTHAYNAHACVRIVLIIPRVTKDYAEIITQISPTTRTVQKGLQFSTSTVLEPILLECSIITRFASLTVQFLAVVFISTCLGPNKEGEGGNIIKSGTGRSLKDVLGNT